MSQIIGNQEVVGQQEDIVQRAQRQLDYAEAGAPGYSQEDIQNLKTIGEGEMPTWIPDWSLSALSGVGRLGEFIDRPAQALRMLSWDFLNILDEDTDVQFSLDDYWDAFAGNDEELARDNPGIMGENQQFGFSQMFDLGITVGDSTYSWEKTDNWWNKILRGATAFSGEAIFDPINLFTGGLSGVGKKVAVDIADNGVRMAAIAVTKAMKTYGPDSAAEFLVKGGKLGTTPLHRRFHREWAPVADRIYKSSDDISWDQAVDQAAFMRHEVPSLQNGETVWTSIDELLPPGVSKTDDMVFFDPVREVTDAAGAKTKELNTFGEVLNQVTGTVARKEFHVKNDIWKDWISHAEQMARFDKSTNYLVTTGGITFGIPFGKQAASQTAVPGLTQVTRGAVSKLTRPLRLKLGGKWVDDKTLAMSQRMSTNAQAMRIAKRSGEFPDGTKVPSNVITYAQYATKASNRNLMEVLSPDFSVASGIRNTEFNMQSSIRKELKHAGVSRKKGGRLAEDRILTEISDAWRQKRATDLDSLDLPFKPSTELKQQADEYVIAARESMAKLEPFAATFLPELQKSLDSGRTYTPLSLSPDGNRLLSAYGRSLAEGSPGSSVTSMIRAVRAAAAEMGEGKKWQEAFSDVRVHLQAKARATGIIDDETVITAEDVLLFMQLVDQAHPNSILMPHAFGQATPFKTRRTGANGMWVYDELTGDRIAMSVFEDPVALNQKMTAMLYSLTEDSGDRSIEKLRKLAGESVFQSNPAELINQWHEQVLEAVLEALDGGALMQTGAAVRGESLFNYNAWTQQLIDDANGTSVAVMGSDLVEKLTNVPRNADGTIPEVIARSGGLEPGPTVKVKFTDKNGDPTEVGMTVNALLAQDEAVEQAVNDVGEVARVVSDVTPAQWQGRVEAVSIERSISLEEASRIVIEEDLANVRVQLYSLQQTLDTTLARNAQIVLEETDILGDKAGRELVVDAVIDQTHEHKKELTALYNQFVDLASKNDTSSAAVRNLHTPEDFEEVMAAAAGTLVDGGTQFRASQIDYLNRQLLDAKGALAGRLRSEVALLEEADRIAAMVSDSVIPASYGPTKIKIISGFQNGVDIESLNYAARAGYETGGTMPSGHAIDDVSAALGHTDQLNLERNIAMGGTQLEQPYNRVNPSKYPARTMKNVDDADVTVVYFPGVGKNGHISGGSASTAFYAVHGRWPNAKKGERFTQQTLLKHFRQDAEGVWVPKGETHKPVMVVGYVAREKTRPDLTGAQHQSVHTYINGQQRKGEVIVNMAGPRAQIHQREMYYVDPVTGEFDFSVDAIKIPPTLEPGYAQTKLIRYGELKLEDGTVFREAVEPGNQTVQQFVDQFNSYLDFLKVDNRAIKGGAYITVEDVINYNMDQAKMIATVASEQAAVYKKNPARLQAHLSQLERQGVDLTQLESAARIQGLDYEDVVARNVVASNLDQVPAMSVKGRVYGRMTGGQRIEVGGTSKGVGVHAGAVKKQIVINDKYRRQVVDLAFKYGVEVEGRDIVPIWEDLRLLKSGGQITEQIPVPFDVTEVPAVVVGRPQWVHNKYGDVIGADTSDVGEVILEPYRVFTPSEDAEIRAVADRMKIPGRKKMEINELVAVMQTEGSWYDHQLPQGGAKWADVVGREGDTWEEALESAYPTHVTQLQGESVVGDVADADTVDKFRAIVPTSEPVFQQLIAISREHPDWTAEQYVDALWPIVEGQPRPFQEALKVQRQNTNDRIQNAAIGQVREIQGAVSTGKITRAEADKFVKQVHGDMVANQDAVRDVGENIYDVMDAYLTVNGMKRKEIDPIYDALINRFGYVGTTDNMGAGRLTNSGVQTPNSAVEPTLEGMDAIDEVMASALSGNVDRSELYSLIGWNPDDDALNWNDLLVDGRSIDQAEVDYVQAIVHQNYGFDDTAEIRIPPVDALKGRKYRSTDYTPGVYESKTSKEIALEDAESMVGRKQPLDPQVPVSGSHVDRATLDPFGKDTQGVDPTELDELGGPRSVALDPQSSAIQYVPEAEGFDRGVIEPGTGFAEGIGQAAAPVIGETPASAGMRRGVTRLMDMMFLSPPGANVTHHLYQTAAHEYGKEAQSSIASLLNAYGNQRIVRRAASILGVHQGKAESAWVAFRQTGNPEHLHDPNFLKYVALARLSTKDQTAKATAETVEAVTKAQQVAALPTLPPAPKVAKGTFEPEQIQTATNFVVNNQTAAVTRIMKEYKVGKAKAERMLDVLEANGVVGPKVRGKQRQVLQPNTKEAVVDVDHRGSNIGLTNKDKDRMAALYPERAEDIPEDISIDRLDDQISSLQAVINQKEATAAAERKLKVDPSPPPSPPPTKVGGGRIQDIPVSDDNPGLVWLREEYLKAEEAFAAMDTFDPDYDRARQLMRDFQSAGEAFKANRGRSENARVDDFIQIAKERASTEVVTDGSIRAAATPEERAAGDAFLKETFGIDPPDEPEVVGTTVSELLGEAPPVAAAPTEGISVGELLGDTSKSPLSGELNTQKQKLAFLTDLRDRFNKERNVEVTAAQRAEVSKDQVIDVPAPVELRPGYTEVGVVGTFKDAISQAEDEGVTLVFNAKIKGEWIDSPWDNPFVPRGRSTTRSSRVHNQFITKNPEYMQEVTITGSGDAIDIRGVSDSVNEFLPIKYRNVSGPRESMELYHDMLWDWINLNPDNAAQVRKLHGQKLVDVNMNKQPELSPPTHAHILSEAADWLFTNQTGRPQNIYRSGSPMSALEDVVLEEALEVREAMQSMFEQLLQTSARTSKDIQTIQDISAGKGSELISSLSTLSDDLAPSSLRALHTLDVAAKAVHGPDARVISHPAGTQGPAVTRIRVPGDDVAAVEVMDTSKDGFDGLVRGYMAGDIDPKELQDRGLDMVIQAGDIETKMATTAERVRRASVDPEVIDATTPSPAQAAEAAQTVQDFEQLMHHVWTAISTGKVKNFREFLGVTDDLTLDASPQYQRIDKAIKSLSTEEEALVRFWMEAAVAADWDWKGQANWLRAWQDMRIPHDNPHGIATGIDRSAARAKNVTGAAKEAASLDEAAAVRAGITPPPTEEAHRKSMMLIDDLIANWEQLDNQLRRINRDIDGDVPFSSPDLDGKRLDPRYYPDRPVTGNEGTGFDFNPNKAGEHESYHELLASIYAHLDELYNDTTLSKLVETKALTEGDIANLKSMHSFFKGMSDAGNDIWDPANPTPGFQLASDFGFAGELSNSFIDPIVGAEMQGAMKRQAAMSTNQATAALVGAGRRMTEWWKRAATLSKLTFHSRNLIGGMWNNMMIGVSVARHWKMMPDVHKFMRARRKFDMSNYTPADIDAYEQLVIRSVSPDNQDMFRAASNAGIFDSQFSSTVQRTSFQHGRWDYTNPFATNFYPYRIGGDVMGEVEGVLRMAAFSKYFDPDYPILSTALGRTMTNAVHFDYNATTEWEDNIKKFVPFWVWTRNNIPLQMRMAVQQPRWINMYEKSRRGWNEAVVDDDDPDRRGKKAAGWVLPGIDRNSDQGWAQMVWNPDLPFMDLLQLPLFSGRNSFGNTPISTETLNMAEWATWAGDMMGPMARVPMDLREEAQRASTPGYAGNIAPVGINAFANLFNIGTPTPQGDRQIPKWTSSLAMTAFPFWYEYFDLMGVSANSPYRAANQGILQGEEDTSSPQKGAMVSGSKIGSGFGFRWYTSKDLFFEDRELEKYLDELDRQRRIQSSAP